MVVRQGDKGIGIFVVDNNDEDWRYEERTVYQQSNGWL